MRIRPHGVELLRAARVVIDAAIAPHLSEDRRDTLHAIDRAMALAEDRIARDVGASAAEIADLERARSTMRDGILEALPPERRYDARLVAKAIAVATRQLANGSLPERREYERLAALLGVPTDAGAGAHEIRCSLASLNERLATRILAGEADVGEAAYFPTLAHLEAVTNEALSESNPTYLRRATPSQDSGSPDSSRVARLPEPVDASLAAWCEVPRAFLRAFPIGMRHVPIARRAEALVHLRGTVGEAIYASVGAALVTQANLFGWFAQRLAANTNVPMIAVEGAHQAHDFSVAIADLSAAFYGLALAPLRRSEPQRAEATRVP